MNDYGRILIFTWLEGKIQKSKSIFRYSAFNEEMGEIIGIIGPTEIFMGVH